MSNTLLVASSTLRLPEKSISVISNPPEQHVDTHAECVADLLLSHRQGPLNNQGTLSH